MDAPGSHLVGSRALRAAVAFLGLAWLVAPSAWAAGKGNRPTRPQACTAAVRAHGLGISFEGKPGKLNAITDVKGVMVGHCTVKGSNLRTGVTGILLRGRDPTPVQGGLAILNGCGEFAGRTWLEAAGMMNGSIALTETGSVGHVHDAQQRWFNKRRIGPESDESTSQVTLETWPWALSNTYAAGGAIKDKHVFLALDRALASGGGPVEEGGVGGGTGMTCFQFKGGIGTASRRITVDVGGKKKQYTVGVLVQANYGARADFNFRGVPIGEKISGLMPTVTKRQHKKDGSIAVVVATDAPLLHDQLNRVAAHAGLGIGNTGGKARNSSGDIFVAFSTARPRYEKGHSYKNPGTRSWASLANESIDPVFVATVQATEEAILNALVAGKTMTGIGGKTVYGLPHGELQKALGIPATAGAVEKGPVQAANRGKKQ